MQYEYDTFKQFEIVDVKKAYLLADNWLKCLRSTCCSFFRAQIQEF